ncbi:MAG: hypothetical protein IPG71_04655 [bacterium]|nr:hypothetical protein [bacterium]
MKQVPRILVIDDEPDLLENCRMILSRETYDVLTLNDGQQLDRALAEFDPISSSRT